MFKKNFYVTEIFNGGEAKATYTITCRNRKGFAKAIRSEVDDMISRGVKVNDIVFGLDNAVIFRGYEVR